MEASVDVLGWLSVRWWGVQGSWGKGKWVVEWLVEMVGSMGYYVGEGKRPRRGGEWEVRCLNMIV